ncbi:hypothetical protein ACOMHN_007321 [Nucella lapillus]
MCQGIPGTDVINTWIITSIQDEHVPALQMSTSLHCRGCPFNTTVTNINITGGGGGGGDAASRRHAISQGIPPDISQGIPPDISQGIPPDISQGIPPDISQGIPQLDISQGIPPSSTSARTSPQTSARASPQRSVSALHDQLHGRRSPQSPGCPLCRSLRTGGPCVATWGRGGGGGCVWPLGELCVATGGPCVATWGPCVWPQCDRGHCSAGQSSVACRVTAAPVW